jgi:hypothetical protein
MGPKTKNKKKFQLHAPKRTKLIVSQIPPAFGTILVKNVGKKQSVQFPAGFIAKISIQKKIATWIPNAYGTKKKSVKDDPCEKPK